MYNILLADDESIVIESLGFIIDHDFPGQCQYFSAGNGSETVKLCRERKTDIAFIDINMPGVNGLEAVREIKQFNPGLVVIIISAFDRFQYAQEAVDLGVFKYLTKPVNRTTVARTVRSAMSIVDSENGKMANDLEIREKLNAMAPIVESDFIYSLIYPVEEHKNVGTYLNYFGIKQTRFFFCTLELPRITAANRFPLYTELHRQLSAYAECVPGPLMINRVVVFFPVAEEMNDEKYRLFVHALYRQLSLTISAGIKIGVSSLSSDLGTSVQVYNQSVAALGGIQESVSGVTFFGDREKNRPASESSLTEWCNRILARVKAGDIQSVSNLFASAMEIFRNYYDNDLLRIKNLLFGLLVLARNAAYEADHSFGGLDAFSNTFDSFASIGNCDDLQRYVLSCLVECVHVFRAVQQTQFPPLIEKVRGYVLSHIDEAVSLEKVSEAVHVHPAYLSKLFHTSTGENFTDFVTSVRLDRAKKMLRTSLMTVKEVTFAAGYNDQNYFSKLFKKFTGQTPTEYRLSVRENI